MNIGSIVQWTSNTIPNGWLLCDGSAVSRVTYSELFSVIGTNFGTGDGSTTFNLPDLRGRVGVGKSSDTEFDTLGETGGSKYLQEHSHTKTMKWANPGEAYGYTDAIHYSSGYTSGTADISSGNVTSLTTGNSGNLQPYIVTNYIIKATQPDTIKISELDSAINITSSDLLPIVQSGNTKKVTASKLLEEVNSDISDILDGEVYSTSEVKTNKVWIDGKPIYRKCFEVTLDGTYTEQGKTYTWVDVDILYNNVIDLKGYINSSNNYRYPLNVEGLVNAVLRNDSIQIGISTSIFENQTGVIILEYTKTTD